MEFKGCNTRCVHSGNYDDEIMGGAASPVFNSTANSYDPNTGLIYYPRYLNIPTQVAVAKKICALENGEDAVVFSSGMAAISSVFFTILKPGDHAVFSPDLYGGTHFIICSEFNNSGIEYSFAASNRPEDIEKEIKANTKLIYIETPSNPLLRIVDIEAVAKIAKKYDILTAIDNTFASPINQTPLNLGIDISIHSGTKYLNGHSDLLCGAIVSSNEIMKRIRVYAINHGAILNGQSCFLLDRGLKTLGIRVKQQNENALKLARFLENHKMVSKVYYPGLETHEDYEIAKRQMRGFGGMLSFDLEGDVQSVKEKILSFKIAKQAGSLGGVESTVTLPAETSHLKMPREERLKIGIKDTLIRVSVGIEDIDDLMADFDQALSQQLKVSV